MMSDRSVYHMIAFSHNMNVDNNTWDETFSIVHIKTPKRYRIKNLVVIVDELQTEPREDLVVRLAFFSSSKNPSLLLNTDGLWVPDGEETKTWDGVNDFTHAATDDRPWAPLRYGYKGIEESDYRNRSALALVKQNSPFRFPSFGETMQWNRSFEIPKQEEYMCVVPFLHSPRTTSAWVWGSISFDLEAL